MISSWLSASGTSVEDKVRNDYRGSLGRDAEHHRLVFTFSAMAFCYKQIRNMVGTLLKIE